MLKKVTISLCLVVVIIMSLIACIEIQKPTVKYERVEVTDMNFEKLKINFIYSIANPNPIGIENAFYNYKLEINNQDFVESLDTQFSLSAGNTSTIMLPIEIKYENVFATGTSFINSLANGTASVPYKISGQFKLNFIAFPFTIPFTAEGSIPLPKLPGISLDSVKMGSIGMTDVQLNINMKVSNENEFPIPINELIYKFKIGNMIVASGTTASKEEISGKGQKSIFMALHINPMSLGQSIISGIQSGLFDYNMVGGMNTGELQVPFDLSGKSVK
ncbi:MAG: hypothetical protein A2Y40_09080 [Candidatus Margulisbacteria bacterium GWF2_35_9]|nr:MAG: hypothetical protein A2Y40_09080 [Candidatus Margulisbacteria bacterium GWF2_35_9]